MDSGRHIHHNSPIRFLLAVLVNINTLFFILITSVSNMKRATKTSLALPLVSFFSSTHPCFTQTDHFAPNFILSNLNHTALDVLNFIHSPFIISFLLDILAKVPLLQELVVYHFDHLQSLPCSPWNCSSCLLWTPQTLVDYSRMY